MIVRMGESCDCRTKADDSQFKRRNQNPPHGGLMFLCLRLDRHHGPSPGDASRIHAGLCIGIIQEGLGFVRFIPLKDECDIIGIIHIAIELIKPRGASGLAVGLVGVEAGAPCILIGHIDTEIDVDHVSLFLSRIRLKRNQSDQFIVSSQHALESRLRCEAELTFQNEPLAQQTRSATV